MSFEAARVTGSILIDAVYKSASSGKEVNLS